jgi:hypothetical protein
VHRPRHADAAGLGEGFEPRRDVDPVATVTDDVAEIDADAELQPPLRLDVGVALGHPALHLDSKAHRVDDAGELDQHAVAGGLDDAAAVRGDLGVAQFGPDPFEGGERALLISSHQPRVAGDIGRRIAASRRSARAFLPAFMAAILFAFSAAPKQTFAKLEIRRCMSTARDCFAKRRTRSGVFRAFSKRFSGGARGWSRLSPEPCTLVTR